MNWLKENAEQWLLAWFQIFDCLFSIFTLEFCYCDLVGWWFGDGAYPTLAEMMTIKRRIASWFKEWVWILEELITILSLNQIHTSFFSICYYRFLGENYE